MLSAEAFNQQVLCPAAGLQIKSPVSSSITKLGKPLVKGQEEERNKTNSSPGCCHRIKMKAFQGPSQDLRIHIYLS